MSVLKITSKENEAFKKALKIVSLKKYETSLEKFTAEGTRLCQEILNCNLELYSLFFTEKFSLKNKNLVNKLTEKAEKSYLVTENLFKKLCDTLEPQGILCICNRPKNNRKTINEICENSEKILILENIQDPKNLGTILRTAECLGVKNIILNKTCCDLYNKKALRGSMGSTFRLNFYFSNDLEKTILKIKNSFKIPVFSSTLGENTLLLKEIHFPKKCAVVIGNEGNGITEKVINASSFKIKIPMVKCANSLNASVAAGIILWEIMKQDLSER